MVKFLTGRGLLSLVSFAPSPADPSATRDFAAVDVGGVLAALRQAPGYQVDRHHAHCGLRTRVLPVLEYVRAMLGSNALPLSVQGWRKDRAAVTWQRAPPPPSAGDRGGGGGGGGVPRRKREFDAGGGGKAGKEEDDDAGAGRVFSFTRSVAKDQRLKFEGAMAADGVAKQFFLAEEWDWTPDEDSGPGASLGREFATTKWLR